MKKILLFASALAGLFLAGSCQRENLEPVQTGQQVTFTIETPAAMQTKAIADGQNVDQLVYEVWLTPTLGNLETGAQKLYQATAPMVSDGTTNKAELTLDLVNDQKFTVLFWAQVADTYDTDELTAIGYKDLTALEANDESLAAFYGVAYVKDGKHVKKDESSASATVSLKRPFAQLNLCTLNTSTAYTVVIEESEMIVESVPTEFNVVNGEVDSYEKVTFAMGSVPSDPSDIKVNGTTYQYAGMNYMFAGANITLEYNIKTELNGQSEATVKNVISDVPLKENYRTNIVGNLLTSQTDFEIIVDADFNIPDELVGEGTVLAKTSEDLVNALKRNEEHLVIDLVGTQTKAMTPVEFQVPVGAWTEKYYFGGDKTRTITINANGNKINFVHENTDWNYIRMVNEDAKWIINDATLTNSGANDGPWNRHDIRFYNAVELNNVTSDKAIALLNDGKLTDVTITEATEAYGLWITADGQTVDIDGLSVTATNDGRGIAIKEEYVESPACVTLNVADASFETAKKAAILVTSKEGAVITLEDVDIAKVAADSDFAVWVDKKMEAYADKVVVNGGLCKVEGSEKEVVAETAKELTDNLKKEGSVVYLYPTADGETLDSEGKLSLGKGASFIGVGDEPVAIVNTWSSNAFKYQANFTDTYVENIFFENNLVIDAGIANGNVTFKNCVFGGHLAHQGVHFDSGEGTVVFDNCTFVGRNMLGSSLEKVIFNNCTFLNKKSSLTGADKWTGVNMWGKYEFNNCEFDTEAHCNVKCDGVVAAFNGCKFTDDRDFVTLINYAGDFDAEITIDGLKLIAEGLMEDENGNMVAHTVAGIEAAVNSAAETVYVENAVEVAGTVELDLNGKTLKAEATDAITVPAGAKLTIKNGNVESNGAPVRAIGGEVVIESGKFVQTGTAVGSAVSTYRYAVDAREGGKVTINGGEFESGNGILNVESGCELVINGGKFTNNVEKSMTRHLAYVKGEITINDGEFYGVANSAAGGCFFCGAASGCDITINGGKFTSLWSSGSVNRIFEVYYGGTINVTGGLFNTNGGIASFVTENTDPATKEAYPYVAK